MSAAALITDLRKAGVQFYRVGTRLIVEAPPGLVTPEIRAELSRSKQELLNAVGRQSPEATGDDQVVAEALREIAALLAAAYRRQQEIRRVPEHHPGAGAQHGLALSGQASVYGVVT